MRSGRSSWMLVCAAAMACASCTFLLGLEDVTVPGGGEGGNGGSGGPSTGGGQGGGTTSAGGNGGAGGCTNVVCPTEVATGQDDPTGITVFNDVAYWVNRGTDQVMMANLSPLGGAQQLFTIANNAEEVAVSSANVYVLYTDTMSGSKRIWLGNESQALAGADDVADIAAGADTVFWVEGPGQNVSKLEGTMTPAIVSGVNNPLSIAVDSAAVYWATSGTIGLANLDGTNQMGLQSPLTGLLKVAVDTTHVYWINGDMDMIQRIAKSDIETAVPDTVVSVPDGVSEFGVFEGTVYWIEPGAVRKAVVGGQPEPVYDGDQPISIFVDQDRVLWTDQTGNVLMLPRQ